MSQNDEQDGDETYDRAIIGSRERLWEWPGMTPIMAQLSGSRIREILGDGYTFTVEEHLAQITVRKKSASPGEKLTEDDVRRMAELQAALPQGVAIRMKSDEEG